MLFLVVALLLAAFASNESSAVPFGAADTDLPPTERTEVEIKETITKTLNLKDADDDPRPLDLLASHITEHMVCIGGGSFDLDHMGRELDLTDLLFPKDHEPHIQDERYKCHLKLRYIRRLMEGPGGPDLFEQIGSYGRPVFDDKCSHPMDAPSMAALAHSLLDEYLHNGCPTLIHKDEHNDTPFELLINLATIRQNLPLHHDAPGTVMAAMKLIDCYRAQTGYNPGTIQVKMAFRLAACGFGPGVCTFNYIFYNNGADFTQALLTGEALNCRFKNLSDFVDRYYVAIDCDDVKAFCLNMPKLVIYT